MDMPTKTTNKTATCTTDLKAPRRVDLAAFHRIGATVTTIVFTLFIIVKVVALTVSLVLTFLREWVHEVIVKDISKQNTGQGAGVFRLARE